MVFVSRVNCSACCFPSLNSGHLAANDVSISRTKRLYHVLNSYIPKEVRETVSVTSHDGRDWGELRGGTFHKVSDWKPMKGIIECLG